LRCGRVKEGKEVVVAAERKKEVYWWRSKGVVGRGKGSGSGSTLKKWRMGEGIGEGTQGLIWKMTYLARIWV
jgi:hypothetical protein